MEKFKIGEIVYIPVSGGNRKQAFISKNFSKLVSLNLIILTNNIVLGMIVSYGLITRAFNLNHLNFIKNNEHTLFLEFVNFNVISILVMLTLLTVLINVVTLTIQRIKCFTPQKGWGFLMNPLNPDRNPERLKQNIDNSVIVGKKNISRFKFSWICTIVAVITVLIISVLNFSDDLLFYSVAFSVSVIINGFINLWIQYNFDDLQILVGKFEVENAKA